MDLRIAPPLLVLLLAALSAPVAEASYLSVPNQRIDRALYHAHGPREVLAGRIEAIHGRSDGVRGDFPFHRDLDLRIECVVLGDASLKDGLLKLTTAHFEWPVHLVPFEVGARLLVVRDPSARDADARTRPLTVVPTRRADPASVGSREEAKRVLERAILTELADTTDPARRIALILQVGPILQPANAKQLLPLLDAEGEWVRRAAIAVLAFGSGEGEHVGVAAEDLRAFLRSTNVRDLIPAAALPMGVVGRSYAPYPLLFDHYFYLVTDWSEEERIRIRPVVALARVVATELDDAERMRWRHGVACLAHAGAAEDADLLYAYLLRVLEGGDHPLHGDLRVRATLIAGLSRILGLENPTRLTARGAGRPPGSQETLAGETAQLARIRDALRTR